MPNDDGLKGSQARLWKLIEERSRSSADLAEIDRRIWDLFGEQWAVMFTDLSGFSRKVAEFGIIHFLQVIYEQRKLLLPIVETHDGLLIKEEGDSLLILFRRVEGAYACALDMQRATEHYNQRRKPEEKILLCVGIGFGDVLRIGDSDVWGREVNAASRLGEDIAKAGEILVTGAARAELGDVKETAFEDVGSGFSADERNYRVRRVSTHG